MEKKSISTRLFGYSKKQVLAFVASLTEEYDTRQEECDAKIARLEEEKSALLAQIKEAKDKVQELEREKDYIASAILKAEQEGQRILENATREADARRREIEADLEAEKGKVKEEKERLLGLKQEAAQALEQYQREIGAIAGKIYEE